MCRFKWINKTPYKHGYYLSDRIYHEWATFVKSLSCSNNKKQLIFKETQKSTRKDVERVFWVQKRSWQILIIPTQSYEHTRIHSMMYACIILHNMIVEYKCSPICTYDKNDKVNADQQFIHRSIEILGRVYEIQDVETWQCLRENLTEHLYQNNMDDD